LYILRKSSFDSVFKFLSFKRLVMPLALGLFLSDKLMNEVFSLEDPLVFDIFYN